MKKIIILGLLFLSACASNNIEKEKLLPIKTMQQTVWQLMQVDEYLSRQIQTDTSIKPSIEQEKYYESVFNLKKIDRVQCYTKMDYLDMHPVDMKELMDSVEALSKREKLDLLKH